MNASNSAINNPVCSDCGAALDTFEMNAHTIGTCTNPECRLNGVTLEVNRLADLTEKERRAWGEQTRAAREAFEAEQVERDKMIARIPAHLRSIG